MLCRISRLKWTQVCFYNRGPLYSIRFCSTNYMNFNDRDPLLLQEQLTSSEITIQRKVREYCKEVLLPRVSESYRNESEDRKIFSELGQLGILGPTIQGYGCAGLSSVASGLIAREIESIDSGYRAAWLSQSCLVMNSIYAFGSEEQKEKYLPRLASGEIIGCFALTEPVAGSDVDAMTTRARRIKGNRREKNKNDFSNNSISISGSKDWITSAPFADIAIVWAKIENTNDIGGFIIERSCNGFTTQTINRKLSLRTCSTGFIELNNCIISEENILPHVKGIKSLLNCLSMARYGVSWGVIGAAETCFNLARDYSLERKQFGRPIASTQLVQVKLADALTEVTLALQGNLRVGRLLDEGKLSHQVISMLKRNNAKKAIEIARAARDIMGAVGISEERHVMRHLCNLETAITDEGSHDVHGLILGRAITGMSAF